MTVTTTTTVPACWTATLDLLHPRIAPRFRRAEARTRVRRYLEALLAPVERKNGWQLAEHLGESGPQGVQRLLNSREQQYVLSVPCTHRIWTVGRQVDVQVLADDVPEGAWVRVSAREGSHGPRPYDWACFALPAVATAGKAHWLLVRRSVSDPAGRAYYRVYASAETATEEMVRVAGQRWCIESALEEAKGLVGVDHYEVRKWEAWHRHITLALLAHAALVVTRAPTAEAEEKRGC